MTNKLMLAAVLALLSSAPALAQDSPAGFDSRWTPYLGCWTVVQNQRGHSTPVPAGTMVCVRPSGRYGVAITTTVDGKNVLEQTIVADGSAQPISQGDCSGTQTSDWSRDGERLFTRVELECANRPKRSISGITLLADGHWIDSQSTVIDGNSDVRLRRYRRSSDQYTGVPGASTAPLSIEDVIEASNKVQSEALEAALDELNSRFTLNSRVLSQLADNGVSPNVIDLMVAQAYPDKFEVERSFYPSPSSASTSYGTSSSGNTTVYMGSTMYPYPMYDPFYSSYYYYSPFAYPYYWGPGYSYRYRYGFSPFYSNYYNYNYYGFGGGGYYGGPSGGGGRDAQPGSPDSRGGDGVVVNGRGYTRVRPAGSSNSSGTGEAATPTSRSSGFGRGVRSASESGSSSSSSSPSSSSSSSSSGSSGASSGGYSSGAGGDSGGGGRTAQPR